MNKTLFVALVLTATTFVAALPTASAVICTTDASPVDQCAQLLPEPGCAVAAGGELVNDDVCSSDVFNLVDVERNCAGPYWTASVEVTVAGRSTGCIIVD